MAVPGERASKKTPPEVGAYPADDSAVINMNWQGVDERLVPGKQRRYPGCIVDNRLVEESDEGTSQM